VVASIGGRYIQVVAKAGLTVHVYEKDDNGMYTKTTALDMLNRIIGIFGADHVPVVSSGHSGFLHHQKGLIPPMSWVGATPSLPCSPRGE
jgi:hypothetical protein